MTDISRTTTSVLTCEPAGPIEADTVLAKILLDMSPPLDLNNPTLEVQYVVSDTLPPGIPVHEQDQLEAYKRDSGPEACYFTVLIEGEE